MEVRLASLKCWLKNRYVTRESLIYMFNKYERMATSNYLLYHKDFASYSSRSRTPPKRKAVFCLYWLLNIYLLIHFSVLLLYPGRTTQKLMGSPMLMTSEQLAVINSIFLFFAVIIGLSKFFFILFEYTHRVHFIDLVLDWWLSPRLFGLNRANTRRLIIRAQLIYWLFFFSCQMLTAMCVVTAIVYQVIACFFMDFPVVNVTFHILTYSLWVRHCVNLCVICAVGIYISITYINYKFDEINHFLRVRIEANDRRGIMAAIDGHYRTIELTQRLAQLYNYIIGGIYLICPYVVGLGLEPLLRPDFNFFIKLVTIFFFGFALCGLYFVNFLCASITVRNDNVPKHLYKVFSTNRRLNKITRLKLEDFLARLNGEYIGFYCLNLFEFTKLAFFQYGFTVSSAYILVTDILDDN